MSKELIILETLNNIKESIKITIERFQEINSIDDFYEGEGLKTLDSISMRLIAIGEAFKQIDKLDKNLLKNYPNIDWKGVKGVRDILSHQYFQIDAEIIYNICDDKLNELLSATNSMIKIVKG